MPRAPQRARDAAAEENAVEGAQEGKGQANLGRDGLLATLGHAMQGAGRARGLVRIELEVDATPRGCGSRCIGRSRFTPAPGSCPWARVESWR